MNIYLQNIQCLRKIIDQIEIEANVNNTPMFIRTLDDFWSSNFDKYLTDRLQIVDIEGATSNIWDIKIGVPQGSIGALLFVILD